MAAASDSASSGAAIHACVPTTSGIDPALHVTNGTPTAILSAITLPKLSCLDGKIAKWWIPDDVQFIDEMPHTATGKIQKTSLRDIFADYAFPK